MPGRKFNTGNYRHGFNGKENDREWGNQLIQDYGFRLYNPAIGKFLSVDPLAPDYPSWTPYAFAMNRVIDGVDLDGLEWLGATKRGIITGGGLWWDATEGEQQLLETRPLLEIIRVGSIGTVSSTEAANLNLDGMVRNEGRMVDGPLRNTYRHSAGQAVAAYLLGDAVATDWADAHEGEMVDALESVMTIDGRRAIDALNNDGFAIVDGSGPSDSFVDQWNNREGRAIGNNQNLVAQESSIPKFIQGGNLSDIKIDVLEGMTNGRFLSAYALWNRFDMPEEMRNTIPDDLLDNLVGQQRVILPTRIPKEEVDKKQHIVTKQHGK